MHPFLNHEFLLNSESAKRLYLEYATELPVFDYLSFLSASDISSGRNFENYTQMSLANDPVKWRVMRSMGIQEDFITGKSTDKEKFDQWARIFPYLFESPLYFQTILELKSIFGIQQMLNAGSSDQIYDQIMEKFKEPEFSTIGILKKLRVQKVVSAVDPDDSLVFFEEAPEDGVSIKSVPAFKTENAINIGRVPALKDFIARLQTVSRYEIRNLATYLAALKDRHDFFHSKGCRLSVHTLETFEFVPASEGDVSRIFDKVIVGGKLEEADIQKFESFMLVQFALWDNQKGWVQNLNLSAVRHPSTRMLRQLGPDSGMDARSDAELTRSLMAFFDHLDKENCLPKTIVNSSSMVHSDSVLSIIGSFQDGSIRGKMQPGFIDWGLAQPQRVISFQRQVASHSLLPLYIGPPSHGRSVSDLIRHDYFRRILCDYLGNAMDSGNMPADWNVAGDMIKDISLRNAQTYFDISG
jgi:glucuronate isomerase